jgi:SAM-dependent methyltransferase
VLYDLGCGDGRIAIAAAREHGIRAVGIDIDPERVAESKKNAEEAGVAGRVEFFCGSLFELDLRPASVVTLYLLPSLNERLRPKLFEELRPGSRVISNHFDMGRWQPDEHVMASWRHVYKWVIPAWIGGRWRCYINHPAGRRSLVLELSRHCQLVQGVARVGPVRIPVIEGRICGDELSFRLVQPVDGVVRYTATIAGTRMCGTCRAKDGVGPTMAWAGMWRE